MASKFALVIANTEYQDASFAKLTAPGKDAEEFAQVLSDAELAAFDDVQVLLNEGESKIRRSIARFFVNRQRDDLLLLYFSGHGVRNDQGQLFLAANDTEISILDATGIPADFVTHSMNNSRSQRQLLILDCCNSGAFAHGSKSASALGKSMGIATAFEGSGFGRVVLTATDATQYAWEGDRVIGNTQKSVFTHFLIEGLKGDADRDGDGRIHVDELYDYAYEQVVRRTPKQTPGKWSYKQQGDLVLRENLKPRDVKPVPLPSDILYYLEHSSSGVRSTGVEELIRLLDGKHLGLARAAQDKLREIAEYDDSLSLRKTANNALMAHGIALEQPIESLLTVKPASVETSKEEPRVAKPDLTTEGRVEGKSEKPARSAPLPIREDTARQRNPRTFPDWKSIAPKLNPRLIGGIVGGLLIISLLIWGGSKFLMNLPATTSEPTQTFQTNVTFTSQRAKTNTPSPTRAAIPLTQTATPPSSALDLGSTMTGKDGMTLLYVPAGEFTMGGKAEDTFTECQKFSSHCQLASFKDQEPSHRVNLDAFWIDETELTNAMYLKCVQAGVCDSPNSTESSKRTSYYSNSKFDNYPVIHVSWDDAQSYCAWVDRRLPTEAEWEKAARGTDGRLYPWGNNAPNNHLLNYDGTMRDTTEVGKYPNGASPYGALDMAGNVEEWVADWYSDSYYASSPTFNPLGPNSGQYHVLRGGSWASFGTFVRSVIRTIYYVPADAGTFIGFRCAMSATL